MKTLSVLRFSLTLGIMALMLVLASWMALLSGPSEIDTAEVLGVLSGDSANLAAIDIVWAIRLPRIVLALLVGASLATSGVIFQALLRNPLADPYILGVSGGAALGAVLMLTLGASFGFGYGAVPPAAFGGCLLTIGLLYLVAGRGSGILPNGLLLTGVVFNAFASAAIVFVASLAGMMQGSRVFLWLIGNLSAVRVDVVPWLAFFLILGLGCAMVLARGLNVITLGEEAARQLGVAVERQRLLLLLASSLMVGAAVSAAGLIGFVGLIIPHLLRLLLGPDHRLLVPASALAGALFLLVCDTVARTVLDGRELPVGAFTALLGGPFFLYLLKRSGPAAVLGERT